MTRRVKLAFVHPPCGDVGVDVFIPERIPTGEGVQMITLGEGPEAMGRRYRPACPLCGQPMQYEGWLFDDTEEEV